MWGILGLQDGIHAAQLENLEKQFEKKNLTAIIKKLKDQDEIISMLLRQVNNLTLKMSDLTDTKIEMIYPKKKLKKEQNEEQNIEIIERPEILKYDIVSDDVYYVTTNIRKN